MYSAEFWPSMQSAKMDFRYAVSTGRIIMHISQKTICILRWLIWVCTVCQLPFYGSPDYNRLMLSMLGKTFSRSYSEFFSKKTMETIWMKCQILLSGKNKETISVCLISKNRIWHFIQIVSLIGAMNCNKIFVIWCIFSTLDKTFVIRTVCFPILPQNHIYSPFDIFQKVVVFFFLPDPLHRSSKLANFCHDLMQTRLSELHMHKNFNFWY